MSDDEDLSYRRCSVLGIPIAAIDYETAVSEIIYAAEQRRPFAVSALAVHGVMTGVQDLEQKYRLRNFDMLCPDGQPVRWALNILHGCALSDRVYGPELMLRICALAAKRGLPIFLFGSTKETLADLSANLQRRVPGLIIAGAHPSRFRRATLEEVEADAQVIRNSGARIVFVGLGCPRQETWVYEMRRRLNMPLVAVGAAFTFHAGALPIAPPLLQRFGLEWLFRLASEPRRLWRRYLLLNPTYLVCMARQWLSRGRWEGRDPKPPSAEQRFG